MDTIIKIMYSGNLFRTFSEERQEMPQSKVNLLILIALYKVRDCTKSACCKKNTFQKNFHKAYQKNSEWAENNTTKF